MEKSPALPTKYNNLFKSLVVRRGPSSDDVACSWFQKLYELKNYKKGIKVADQILKKFPEHGGEFFGVGYPRLI